LHPLYEAAAEHGLAITLQAGGSYVGANLGVTGVGFPASVLEHGAQRVFAGAPHLASLLCQGVFGRFPALRLVMSGFGIAWLPSLLWALDRAYLDGEVDMSASVDRLPSELVHERVRFTIEGLEVPADRSQLHALLELIDARQLLLCSSGSSPQRSESV